MIKSNLTSLPGKLAQWTNIFSYGLILLSAVYIIAAILNIAIKT
jgi:hypothetical protein